MKRIAIIGLGVIGASIGMALRSSCPQLEIWGSDIDPLTIERALEMEAVNGILPPGDVSGCDVVFIATPLRIIPGVLQDIKDSLEPGAIVTDVGSVKQWIMEQFAQILPPHVTAIGGHPLAGSDRSGITGADQYLLQNAIYVLTPADGTDRRQIARLQELLDRTGAKVMLATPLEHDRMVSQVSHLPHIVAASLMNNLQAHPDALQLAAGGLRDTTRIAASNPELWEDILILNRSAVAAEIRSLIGHLQRYEQALEQNQGESLRGCLAAAQQLRKTLRTGRLNLVNTADITAIVQDKPGIIGTLGAIMGEAGININDIQIMGVREENEGSVRLGVPLAQAGEAVQKLKENGIRAWIRD
ncbi:MAG: prephenate dehydrogenase [Syntrophomonadaceae bacterium]